MWWALLIVLLLIVGVVAATQLGQGSNGAAGPSPTVPPTDEQVLQQVYADSTAIANSQLLNRWAPQLASIVIGQAPTSNVLADLQSARSKYGQVLLLKSDDFKSRANGYWILVVAQVFDSGDSVRKWCVDNGLESRNCIPRYVSHD